jgi:hypothetical protein
MTDRISMTAEEWYDMSVEVTLPTSDDFLKIKETLTRIGIGTKKDGTNRLYQTCHILQKRGKYYIVHFKELLLLDGKEVNLTDFDIKRRNTIIGFLSEWGLLEVVDSEFETVAEKANPSSVRIIPFSEKNNWDLVPKYTIGNK